MEQATRKLELTERIKPLASTIAKGTATIALVTAAAMTGIYLGNNTDQRLAEKLDACTEWSKPVVEYLSDGSTMLVKDTYCITE